MVNHDIPHGISSERVVTVMYFRLAAAETHVTHNDIVRIHPEGLPCYADSVSRSGLSGNGHIRSADNDGRFQLDDARHIEHNDTRPTGFASLTERSGATVIQIGHGNHLSATSAKGKHTSSFSSRECGDFCLRQIIRAGSPWYIRATFSCFFLNNRQCFCPSFV